ncbi:MAG: hypothetical protein ACYCQJ_01435 [Nitrososphaerales archaeon]
MNVSPKAVKSKLDFLLNEGTLQGIAVRPDPSLFGMRRSGFLMSFDNQIRRTIEEKVKLLDFIECVHITKVYLMQEGKFKIPGTVSSTYVAEMDIIHHAREELDNKIELLRSLLGNFDFIYPVTFRSASASIPSENILRFLKELIKDPFGDLRELAKASSIYEKTAAKYLNELAKNGSIVYEPIVDFRKGKHTTFHLGVPVDPSSKQALLKKLKERLADNWLGVNRGDNLIGISCVAKDLGAIDNLYFELMKDKELADAVIVFGLYTIDNSSNSEYMHPY